MNKHDEENILSQISNSLINENYLTKDAFKSVYFWFQLDETINYGNFILFLISL
jgi:hypothetical protein